MAKIIETKDGIRLLVSDDTPEDIDYDMPDEVKLQEEQQLVDVVTVTISLDCVEHSKLPVQTKKLMFTSDEKGIATVSGIMTLEDFLWLAEHKDKTVTGLSTAKFPFLKGNHKITRLTGKDMNVFTVHVNLSLKKHT